MFYYVINVSVCANYFSSGFICGAGCPVGSFFFSGVGVLKCGDTPVQRIWVTNQMSLGLKHFVLEGVM